MLFSRLRLRETLAVGLAVCLMVLATGPTAQAAPAPAPEIERGFHLLYGFKFDEARSQFHAWELKHPQDPVGPASEAASYLFQEFYRQGVLTSEFFRDDQKLLGGAKGSQKPQYGTEFLEANRRAQALAQQQLKANPQDPDALFVLTLTTGMLSNYTALIEKRHLESLKLVRQAEGYANRLLALQPDAFDAYLALGATNYIVGCLPGYKRFFLWFGGIHGDREQGMKQLEITASRGHYLRPYAKILLALAAIREEQPQLARSQLEELVAEFPQNSLFVSELNHLKKSTEGSAAR